MRADGAPALGLWAASLRARETWRIDSSSGSGIHKAPSCPAREHSASCKQSQPPVLTRSPARLGTCKGAVISPTLYLGLKARRSPKPVGPASYKKVQLFCAAILVSTFSSFSSFSSLHWHASYDVLDRPLPASAIALKPNNERAREMKKRPWPIGCGHRQIAQLLGEVFEQEIP